MLLLNISRGDMMVLGEIDKRFHVDDAAIKTRMQYT